jgi:hypothetical protein
MLNNAVKTNGAFDLVGTPRIYRNKANKRYNAVDVAQEPDGVGEARNNFTKWAHRTSCADRNLKNTSATRARQEYIQCSLSIKNNLLTMILELAVARI